MHDFSANQWDLSNIYTVLLPTIKAGILFPLQDKKALTRLMSPEGQTRSWGKTVDISFSHTGETGLIPVLIQGFFHVFNEAKWNPHSNYF